MKLYGLKNKKTNSLLYVSASSNEGGDCCTDIQYTLSSDRSDLNLWLVDSLDKAEKARTTNTAWYNASFDTPSNPFTPDELEVVELEVKGNINS